MLPSRRTCTKEYATDTTRPPCNVLCERMAKPPSPVHPVAICKTTCRHILYTHTRHFCTLKMMLWSFEKYKATLEPCVIFVIFITRNAGNSLLSSMADQPTASCKEISGTPCASRILCPQYQEACGFVDSTSLNTSCACIEISWA